MTKTLTREKQSCPCCGQSVNKRLIRVDSSMVQSLKSIYTWAKETGRHEFKRKEIAHLFKTDSEVGHFGDWVHFGGIFYKKQKGSWGIHLERAYSFLKGEAEITLEVYYDPLAKTYEVAKTGKVRDVRHILSLIAPDGSYIVDYIK